MEEQNSFLHSDFIRNITFNIFVLFLYSCVATLDNVLVMLLSFGCYQLALAPVCSSLLTSDIQKQSYILMQYKMLCKRREICIWRSSIYRFWTKTRGYWTDIFCLLNYMRFISNSLKFSWNVNNVVRHCVLLIWRYRWFIVERQLVDCASKHIYSFISPSHFISIEIIYMHAYFTPLQNTHHGTKKAANFPSFWVQVKLQRE